MENLENFTTFVRDLVIGCITLFSIINPFGMAFVFLARTRGLEEARRKVVARRIGINAFVIMIVSFIIGGYILRFFGITVPALRVAGGLVVAMAGWKMLNDPDSTETAATATPGATDASRIEAMTFFPLTIPLTTGPGTIAAAVALGASHPSDLRGVVSSLVADVLVSFIVAIMIVVAYANAVRFANWVGQEGTRVITRISAFLLLCVGVQIMLTGVTDILPQLITQGIQAQRQP